MTYICKKHLHVRLFKMFNISSTTALVAEEVQQFYQQKQSKDKGSKNF